MSTNKRHWPVAFSASVLVLLGSAHDVQAAISYYIGFSYNSGEVAAQRAAFQAAAGGGLAMEGFNTYFADSPSVSFPIGGPEAFSAAFSSADGSNDNLLFRDLAGKVSEGTHAMVCYLATGDPGRPDPEDGTLTFSFSTPLTAFGVDINDFGDGDGYISYSDNLGNTNINFADGSAWHFFDVFFGVTNSVPFDTVVFSFDDVAGDSMGFDRLEYQAIPEPSSIALWAVGSLCIGAFAYFRRRRRR